MPQHPATSMRARRNPGRAHGRTASPTSGTRHGASPIASGRAASGTSSGRGQGWNKWSAGDKAKDKGGEPQSDLKAQEETEDAEELKMQEALLQSAVEEAWSDKSRVLSFSELPKEHRGTPYKECVDNVEADAIESMEDRIKAHAKVPDAMLHYIARFLAALPQGSQRAQVDPAHRQP